MRKTEEYLIVFETADEKSDVAKQIIKGIFELFDSLKGAVIIVFLLFTFVFRAVGVEGDSMVPTLTSGDWVAVTAMQTDSIRRGDIVVVTQPWDRNVPIIKRVIGIQGDKIMIDFEKGMVYVNGIAQLEKYVSEPTTTSYDIEFPVTVPEGKVFLMGDNRNVSLDSRSSRIGFIDESYILGKAVIRIYPFSQWSIYENEEEE